MAHRLVSLVMLFMLILQGVSLASADLVFADESQSMEHCAGHDETATDCPCCSDSDAAGVSCASQCSASATAPVFLLTAVREPSTELITFVDAWAAGPAYSPLNPPPIA